MRNATKTPATPSILHHLPGASLEKAVMVLAWVLLPMRNSLIITGTPTANTHNKYIRIKAAPPLLPTSVGKRQILPRPTALPADAKTTPHLLAKLPLLSIFLNQDSNDW